MVKTVYDEWRGGRIFKMAISWSFDAQIYLSAELIRAGLGDVQVGYQLSPFAADSRL